MESPKTIDFDFEGTVLFSAAAAAHSAHSITTPSVTAAEEGEGGGGACETGFMTKGKGADGERGEGGAQTICQKRRVRPPGAADFNNPSRARR